MIPTRTNGLRAVRLALGLVLIGGVAAMLLQSPRYVSSSSCLILGCTNLAMVDSFAQGLVPKYPTVFRVRVRNFVLNRSSRQYPRGQMFDGFSLEVAALGPTREAAMRESDAMARQFLLEVATIVNIHDGYSGHADEARPYSTLRDGVLRRIGPTMTRLCANPWLAGVWGRLAFRLGYSEFP